MYCRKSTKSDNFHCRIPDSTQGVVYTKFNDFAICGTNNSQVAYNAGANINSNTIYILNYYEGVPVTQIGAASFRFNSIIQTVYIPKNVEYMFWDTFAYCDNLENVYFEEDSHLFYIFSGSIYFNKKLKHLRILKSITAIPTYLSLGANMNIQTVTYCGSASFPNLTFSTVDEWDKIYCPKAIYVMEDYPYDNFGGCYSLVRIKQCTIYPRIPCLTLRYNNFRCNNYFFSIIIDILIT